jgi:hypothetical protein
MLSRSRLIQESKNKIYRPDVDATIEALGYFLIPNAIIIPETELKHILRIHTEPIFNNTGTNDRKRRQGKITETFISTVIAQIRAIGALLYPELYIVDPVVLQSLADCGIQRAHMDYIPHTLRHLQGTHVPRGVLVSLQPGTKLDVWPGSHRSNARDIQRRTLALDKGDVLFFRGDLIHAGSSYRRPNSRLHMHLDSKLVPRTTNRTYIISVHGSSKERARIANDTI